MNTKSLNCRACGTAIADGGVDSLCPKCLLAQGMTVTTFDGAVTVSADAAASNGAPSNIRYFGDYELIEEIARGGMGVVYKARQVNLNRVVAVKMILSGSMASETEVRRFRTEAESAANLQHPGIVAIHEVGLHDGQHYFSMDFVDGPNLSQALADRKFSPIEIAQCVKQMADAVHYAHQRGILHRDLKPQNVLIDDVGAPRITDFGLARPVDNDTGATRTGAVLGSPAYMPPEQATGRQEKIGPHSDVYSLGAILYQMLAGRPPFTAESVAETLREVAENPPVPPSKLNPNASRDLETVCLKCLEKLPERRYASARLLSEELARFINGEPVLARPAGAARKAWSWMQRNPWALAGASSMALFVLVIVSFALWQRTQLLEWKMSHPGQKAAYNPLLFQWVERTPMGGKVALGWLGYMLFASGPILFADFIMRKGRQFHFKPARLAAYGIGGVAEMLLGLGFVLMFTKISVWQSRSGLDVMDLVGAGAVATPFWFFGALLISYSLREQRSNEFGPSRGLRPELFTRPEAEAGLQILYRGRHKILFLIGLMIANCLWLRFGPHDDVSDMKRAFRGMSATYMLMFLILLRRSLGNTKANRHFFIFGAALFGCFTVGIGIALSTSRIAENLLWTVVLPGIAGGTLVWLVLFLLDKLSGEVDPEDFKPARNGALAWAKANPQGHKLLLFGVGIASGLVAYLGSGDPKPGVVLFVAAMIPGLATTYLRAKGQARQARAVPLIFVMAAIIPYLIQEPTRFMLWAAPLFLLLGTVPTKLQLNWEKRRSNEGSRGREEADPVRSTL